jgi:hypothetical protein
MPAAVQGHASLALINAGVKETVQGAIDGAKLFDESRDIPCLGFRRGFQDLFANLRGLRVKALPIVFEQR